MLLMIDNYDSFTYNLVQYLKELHNDVLVHRNDEISLSDIKNLQPECVVISPGPGRPEDAGITLSLIKKFAGVIPILGICLGHQAIAQAFGARIIRAKKVMHGKTSLIYHDESDIFSGIKMPLTATRYHSLVIEKDSLPNDFNTIAWTDESEIMGIQHKTLPLTGLQFHPESILTEQGHTLLQNFINHKRAHHDTPEHTWPETPCTVHSEL